MPWSDGLPKCELHRHLGGAIQAETIWKIIKRQGLLDVADSLDGVKKLLICNGDDISFEAFLAKFEILNKIKWDEAAIIETTTSACELIKLEDIDYVEMSFSIDKYLQHNRRWSRHDVIRLIYDIIKAFNSIYETRINLILSLKMESNKETQILNAAVIEQSATADRLCGLDIVGDEKAMDCDFYVGLFKNWRSAGKTLVAHAGEICGADNVWKAIVKLKVNRVRHGIAASQDETVLSVAKDHDICFDVSLHSNLLTGTVRDIRNHPIKHMLKSGCKVNLGTDDPVVLSCTLDAEYDLALTNGLITESQAQEMKLNSLYYSNFQK